jgi:hypothetical protein
MPPAQLDRRGKHLHVDGDGTDVAASDSPRESAAESGSSVLEFAVRSHH